jgi:MFS family permease
VWLIGLISLVNDSASEMIYPLIPLYLSAVLMAGPKTLGLIEGVAEATASLLKLFSGLVYDRTRRARPWIVFGYSLAGLGRPLIAFVAQWPWLLAIRFADRLGKGLRSSPRDALLAASVGAERRGLAFGLHRAMDNAGAVLGPLVAAVMLGMGATLKQVFLWTALPAAVCFALAVALREAPAPAPPAAAKFDWRVQDLPVAFRRYLLVIALFSLGNSSNMFLLLRARELGVPESRIPLLWAVVSAVAAVFSTPLSAWSDRIGRVRVLGAGFLAYGAFYALLGSLASDGAGLFLLFAFYGLFMAATEGVEKALVADLAPTARRGACFGWFNLTAGAMLLPASVLFGWLYEAASPSVAFTFSAGCAIMSAVLLRMLVAPGLRRTRAPDAASPHGLSGKRESTP